MLKKKGEEEIKFQCEELANFIITSGGDAFLCSDDKFRKVRVTAHIPDTVLKSMWSIGSIHKHIRGETSSGPFGVFDRIEKPWKYYLNLDNIPGGYTVNAS